VARHQFPELLNLLCNGNTLKACLMCTIQPDPGTTCLLHETPEKCAMLMGVELNTFIEKIHSHKFFAGDGYAVGSVFIVMSCSSSTDNSTLYTMCVGYCWAGALQDNHHSLLQGSHGFHSHVWHYQWGVLQCCARLVRDIWLCSVEYISFWYTANFASFPTYKEWRGL